MTNPQDDFMTAFRLLSETGHTGSSGMTTREALAAVIAWAAALPSELESIGTTISEQELAELLKTQHGIDHDAAVEIAKKMLAWRK